MECRVVGLVHCVCEFGGVRSSALDSHLRTHPSARRDLVGLGLVGSAPQPDGWPLPSSLRELYFGESPNVTGPIPPGWRLPDSEQRIAAASSRDAVPLHEHAALASAAPACGRRFSVCCTKGTHARRLQRWSVTPRCLCVPLSLCPSAALTVLYALGLPLGGTISPEWVLPDSLQFLNMGRCNLSGSLPEDWLLPANLTGLTLAVSSAASWHYLGSSRSDPGSFQPGMSAAV